ncbi:MAG: hypothetical protein EA397_20150 [Deltaproteobacteria bacterium]|nr:MAG: hypothetical protein EA397_20150 [Deltaproteobacteria bacterium]
MRKVWIPMVATLAAACQPDDPTIGYVMDEYFPFDGEVIGWTFGNMNESVDYLLHRTFDPDDSVTVDEIRRHTFTTFKECSEDAVDCEEGFVWEYVISGGAGRGVALHAYERQGEARVELEPPIRLANPRMAPGETLNTASSGGHAWTSTFASVEDCEQTLDVQWRCAKITLQSDPPGHWLTGDWYGQPGYNLVSFERAEDPGRWRLVELPVRP